MANTNRHWLKSTTLHDHAAKPNRKSVP